jgi:hypothetical protein
MPEANLHSHKLANVISAIVFVLCMGIFAYIGVQNWLPFLILNAGIGITLRQVLVKNHVDTIVCLLIFGAAFITSLLGFFAVVFLPSLFILAGIYFIIRQFVSLQSTKTKTGATTIEVDEEAKSNGGS